ncbi:hypothetical protein RDI61_14070 [Pseudomonas plecoglossicida]|uniref:hypothetical protein n=1 Tax=Pseudomonas TaxID=286 RepID=UPI000761D74F|nr:MULTISPECIES: hypothetical protein [Pseudomonas]MDQ7965160.1 hypothetical protein [Pseudomonas plecoglossicida]WBM44610.1 hypothetical protein M2J85_17895 [Pseudomonas putida]WFG01034.1 hypothetical protein P3X84_18080 [Pseudomonas putida]
MPESKELEIQLDGKGNSDLAYLARQNGLTPEQLAAQIINEALNRMTRTEPGRSNVRSFRKG